MSAPRSSSSHSEAEGETIVEPSPSADAREVKPARAAWAELAGLPDVILPGTLLGRYVVLEVVGRGAMGTVVRAYDPRLRREVAVKRLRPRASAVHEAETRLVREARAMAQLNHPNVVAVYDVDAESGIVLVAMEYVRGCTLREWLQTPRSPREILDAFRQAAAGLAAAHAAGLVHRDFKPANVLVESPHGSHALGRVRVTDFGLARGVPTEEVVAVDRSDDEVIDAVDPRAADPLTLAGVVMGTPAYMAPEQHRGETAGPAADQYAFCIALWEGLVGRRPFEAENIDELVRCKTRGAPPWPKAIDVPARIGDALRRGLATDPADRFATLDEIVAALADEPGRSAQRRAFAAAGVIAAAGASLAIAGWQRSHSELCTGAADRIAEVWNPERRAAAESAMLAGGQAYAGDAWAAIVPSLDGWTAEWIRMHTDSCEATAVRGEQSTAVMDLRMACLQRAHGELRSVTDMLVHADPAVVLHAHTIVAGLPALDRCADIVALQSDVPPPTDGAIANEVDEIRNGLADARARSHIGKSEDALARIDELVTRAQAFDYPPIHAEIGIARGQALATLGRFADAEAELRAALRSALHHGQLRHAAWAASGLTLVVGDRMSRAPEGLAFADVAIGLAQNDVGDPRAEASARNNLANVLNVQGRYAEAEAEHRRVLAMRIELRGEQHYDVASSRLNLGNVLANAGRLAEATQEITIALAILREHLGDEHPEVASAHTNLGGIALTAGHPAEAEVSFREALRIRLATQDSAHVQVAEARGNLGNALQSQGRLDEAEHELRATVTGIESKLGTTHPSAAIAHNNLASLLQSAGRTDEAEAEYRSAYATADRALGATHPLTLTFRHNLAGARSDAGHLDEAEAELRAVAKLRIEALGADHPDVARTSVHLGTTLLQAGRLVEAEAAYRDGVAVWERAVGPDHVEIGMALVGLGRSLARQDRDADALPELERAYDLLREQRAPAEQRAEAAFILAQVLWATPSQRDRALQLAREANDTYATVLGTRADAPRRAVVQWLASPRRHERGPAR